MLEDAIKKHHNIATGGTPMWLYVVLAYFAYDDIFRMMFNPFIFTPFVLILSIVGMLYSMGMGPVMVPVMRQQTNMVLRRVGMPY